MFKIMAKVYEIFFEDEFKVSLVKSPAVQSTLIKFSAEENEKLYFADDEKRIVYSVAMIPNKLIFRKDIQGEPAEVFYTAETIAKFQQEYFRTNANGGTNVNHAEFNTEGIYPFENWIVNDDNRAELLGLNAPKGSLVMGFKIDNDQVWSDVKNGDLDGLSVEGRVVFKEQLNKVIMNKQSILTDIKAHQIKMAGELKQFGDVYAMSLAEGEIVSDAEGTPKTDAEFEHEGKMYKTDSVGAIVSIEDVVAVEEEMAVEEVAEVETEDKDAIIADLQAKLADAEEKAVALEAEKVKAETDLVKMQNETPAANPIVNAPIEFVKPYAEMTNREKYEYNRR